MATITTITIKNWDTYQPRRDRKQHTWFRLENSIAYSETLHGLTIEQKWFWVCLLGYASKKGIGTIPFSADYFAKTFGVSTEVMIDALEKLAKEPNDAVILSYDTDRLPVGNHPTPTGNQSVTERLPSGDITSSHGSITSPDGSITFNSVSLQTNKQTNKQTDMQPAAADFDFEKVYAGYPRKEGKDEGMALLKQRIRTQADFDRFARAASNYASRCRIEGRDRKYTLKWSTFVGEEGKERWRDFEDPKDGTKGKPPHVGPNAPLIEDLEQTTAVRRPVRPTDLPEDQRTALRALTGGKVCV